jgi:poly-beta-1,6-N-acetyl-D-glucosamine synthase
MVLSFIITYSAYSISQLIGLFRAKKKDYRETNSFTKKINLNSTSLIIPFRNESKRITELLNSIKRSPELPLEVLFINDHSNDDSVNKIESNLKDYDINYKVIHLTEDKIGKKEAIRFGIKNTSIKTKYILTFDADISFNEKYFTNLKNLPLKDLYILPVIMKGKGLLESFFSLDYNLLNTINRITFGFKRPILASGANLLFCKEVFTKLDSIHSHKHIASGDDMFLLRDFVQNKASIHLYNHKNNIVKTSSPSSIYSFYQQRVRWISKNKTLNDKLNNKIIFFNSVILFFFYLTIIKYISKNELLISLFILIFKNFLDLLIISVSEIKLSKTEKIILPFYTVIQPFYYLSLWIIPLFHAIKWKERDIKKG